MTITIRKDAGQLYSILRALPGTFTVQGDPDEFISFHMDWDSAKAALLAAIEKDRHPGKKAGDCSAAVAASISFIEQVANHWAMSNQDDFAKNYRATYCMALVVLAYANGVAVKFGTSFAFLSSTEDLPRLLDEWEQYRYPKKPVEPRTGLTEQELKDLFAQYGLGPETEAPAEAHDEAPPL